MEDYYYTSNIRKELEDIAISCLREETVIPYITESEDKIHNVHDKGYKYLFSVKKNFIDFVKTFMRIELNIELTEENITLMDKEFITKEFGKKESDVIYEVKSDNKIVYFVLIELQQSFLATQLCFVEKRCIGSVSQIKIWTELKEKSR